MPIRLWDDHYLTLSNPVEINTATAIRFVSEADGTSENPYLSISDALDAIANNTDGFGNNTRIIRVMGNSGIELTGTTNLSGRPGGVQPNALVNNRNPYHYYIGVDEQGQELPDGRSLLVPANVTLMIESNATLRMGAANVEVGSSSELVLHRPSLLHLGCRVRRCIYLSVS